MPPDLTPFGRAPSEVLRWPTNRSKDWVARFLDSALTNSNILAVIAVGSAIRSDVPSADVDLIAICGDAALLQESPPLEVDLRAYSAGDLDAQIGRGHDMLGWAIRFGRVLFQRDHFWDRVADSWRGRLPLPSAAIARGRASAAHQRLAKVFELDDVDASYEQALLYLTHLARAELLDNGVYPASRPEMAAQLRTIGRYQMAGQLDRIISDGERGESPVILQLLQGPA